MADYFTDSDFLIANREIEDYLSSDENIKDIIKRFREQGQEYLNGRLATGHWEDVTGVNSFISPFDNYASLPTSAKNWLKVFALKASSALFLMDRAKGTPDWEAISSLSRNELDFIDATTADILNPDIKKRFGGIPGLVLVDAGTPQSSVRKLIVCSKTETDRRLRTPKPSEDYEGNLPI